MLLTENFSLTIKKPPAFKAIFISPLVSRGSLMQLVATSRAVHVCSHLAQPCSTFHSFILPKRGHRIPRSQLKTRRPLPFGSFELCSHFLFPDIFKSRAPFHSTMFKNPLPPFSRVWNHFVNAFVPCLPLMSTGTPATLPSKIKNSHHVLNKGKISRLTP